MMMMMMMIIIIIIIRPSNTKTYVTQSGSRHPSGQPDPGKLVNCTRCRSLLSTALMSQRLAVRLQTCTDHRNNTICSGFNSGSIWTLFFLFLFAIRTVRKQIHTVVVSRGTPAMTTSVLILLNFWCSLYRTHFIKTAIRKSPHSVATHCI